MKPLKLYCHLSIIFTVVFIICMIIDDYVFIEKLGSNIIWDDLLWFIFIWGIYYIAYFLIFSLIFWTVILSTHLLKLNRKQV